MISIESRLVRNIPIILYLQTSNPKKVLIIRLHPFLVSIPPEHHKLIIFKIKSKRSVTIEFHSFALFYFNWHISTNDSIVISFDNKKCIVSVFSCGP